MPQLYSRRLSRRRFAGLLSLVLAPLRYQRARLGHRRQFSSTRDHVPDVAGLVPLSALDQFTSSWALRHARNASAKIFNVQDPEYGATGDGITDDTDAWQSAMTDAVLSARSGTPTVLRAPAAAGYKVSRSIIAAMDAATSVSGLAVVGEESAWGYDGVILASVLRPISSFRNDAAVLDLRHASQTLVRNIGIDMSDCVNHVTGIEYGDRMLAKSYSSHHVEGCSIHHGYYGIRANNASVFRICNNNLSAHASAAVYFEQYSGDADFEGNYVSTNASYGYYFGVGCGNINVRGGKCEWNAFGIGIFDAQGITVSGVQFDTNSYYCIGVQCDTATVGNQPRSITITGNRFLGGGTLDGGGIMGKSHIAFNIGANNLRMIIVGNSFRKGGTAAYDYNSTGTVGPLIAAIRGQASAGGSVNIMVEGNDLVDCSTHATYSVSGGDAGTVINDYCNDRNLFIEVFGSATIRGCRPMVSVALIDTPTVTPNVPEGADRYTLSAAGSRTICAPTNAVSGQEFTFELFNNSGGVMTTMWSAAYALAGGTWTDPAAGKRRSVRFKNEGGVWREQWRTSGDV